MDAVIAPSRRERTDLIQYVWLGCGLAVATLIAAAWSLITSLRSGHISVVLQRDTFASDIPIPAATPTLTLPNGKTLDQVTEYRVLLEDAQIPSHAATLLRLGQIAPILAFTLAILVFTFLIWSILRYGVFDRSAMTRTRVLLVLSYVAISQLPLLSIIGGNTAIDALGLGETYRAPSTDSLTVLLFLLSFFLVTGWIEAMIQAGRRLARDQGGVI